ncbi:MAG: ABC transporter permease [Deltaproteobacteria bacterium]|nr:ABC transporter permease [Deltaproteobacteria bacterium]
MHADPLKRMFILRYIAGFGHYIIFCAETFRRMFFPLPDLRLLLHHMEFIGVKSLGVIILASIMIGAVFGINFGSIMRLFGAESMVGAAASFALSKELAPVIGSFLVTGRSGSAMAAEMASMRVNEQIDAMKVMSVNPVAYLASPRVLASMIMMPLLCGFFIICGILSCFLIGVMIFDVDVGIFIDKIRWITKPQHILQGLEKAMIFGAIFSTIGCYKGFSANGGARGVGRATTEAVVTSLVTILLCDVFISYFQMEEIF